MRAKLAPNRVPSVRIAVFFAALAAALTARSPAAAEEALVLAENGKTSYRIVLAADAIESEKYAAEELALHLRQITGATFPVETGAEGKCIVLKADAQLAPEEYSLQTRGESLVISGGRTRGVLYGVYALLEEQFGCRWYTPEVQRVHTQSALQLAPMNQRFKPRLEYREAFWTEAQEPTWAARNRMNSAHARLTARHGGKVAYGPFVHTFNLILNPDVEFPAHPEYFSMIDGKRVSQHTQLCLTNPEVLQRAIAKVNTWIKAQPDATIFSVSQNDWHNPCACPACKAIDDAEGSHAGTLIRFVNAIAEAIEKEHPRVAIDTLAYQYTRKPPKTVVPRHNVIVRLCSIECCFAHPLDGCTEATNAAFLADLKGWNALTKRLYVWDYTTNFAHYLLPFPNLDVLDKNVRTFADNGVVGLFEQGNYAQGGGGELAPLRSWVLAKLLWNPSLDGERLIREFIAGVYGPAAEKVQAFIDLQRRAIRESGEHVRIFDGYERRYLRTATLKECAALLDDAARIAEASGDAGLVARVKRLQMPVWYTRVWQNHEDLESVIKPAAHSLLDAAKELKVTHFREDNAVPRDIKRIEMLLSRKAVPPEHPDTIVGEDHAFRLFREGDLVGLVADPKAGDGFAARQAGRTREWSVAWNIPVPEKPVAAKYRLRVRVRVEKNSDIGAAFHTGVYDELVKKSKGEIQVKARDCDGEYHWYTVAELDPAPGRYAYVAPDDNAANVTAVFTDRMELIPITDK